MMKYTGKNKEIGKKKNNKGFTLVELIIVIAIIAILATVFAPQYTKYVEEARQAQDLQLGTSLVNATTIAMIDPSTGIESNDVFLCKLNPFSFGLVKPSFSISSSDSADADKVKKLMEMIVETMGWKGTIVKANTSSVDYSIELEEDELPQSNLVNNEDNGDWLAFNIFGNGNLPQFTFDTEGVWGEGGIGLDIRSQ